jgi:MFS family permease
MIILPEMAPDDKSHNIAGMIGAVIAIAGVLGPVLGGILTRYSTWRWVFWINGPIGGTAGLLFFLAWPPQKYLPRLSRRKWSEIDFVGSFLLLAGAILVTFSFQNAGANSNQWNQPVFLAPLILGVFCLIALFAWQAFVERRWGDRVAAAIPLVLMRNRVFACGVLNIMCMGFPYLMCIYVFPIRFQIVNGKSSLEAGLMLLPMLGTAAMGSFLGGAINGRQNRICETLMVACALMLLGCALETMTTESAYVEARTLGFLSFIGLGFGLSATAATMLANLESPEREHGMSSTSPDHFLLSIC